MRQHSHQQVLHSPPETTADISTLDEFAFLSIWLYRSLEDGTFDYAHFELEFQALIGNTNLDVLAAAVFFGLIPASALNSSLWWVFLFGE